MAKKKKRTQADYEELARRAASGDFPTRPLTIQEAIQIARSHKCGYDCFDPDGNWTGYCKHAIANEIEEKLG
jgi:hypothetical protein